MSRKLGPIKGRYEFIQELGKGAFGQVQLARCCKDEKLYAIKFIKKQDMIKMKHVVHVDNERNVCTELSAKGPHGDEGFPFIVNMIGYSKDARFLYIVMEFVPGGDLFGYIHKARKAAQKAAQPGAFDEERARFYTAVMVSALAHIHSKKIAHRDLKPENTMMCADGYLKLTDFGLAKFIDAGQRTFTMCGTPEYIAPEVLKNQGHGMAVDWWGLGVMVYEFVTGTPPFQDEDIMGIYRRIMKGQVYFPRYFGSDAKAFVKRLLNADLSQRFGNLVNGAEDLRQHEWFQDPRRQDLDVLDFQRLLRREIEAPFLPSVKKGLNDLPGNIELSEDDLKVPMVKPENCPFQEW